MTEIYKHVFEILLEQGNIFQKLKGWLKQKAVAT
jgi:hypothetical protein